jgi:hypothetical protein
MSDRLFDPGPAEPAAEPMSYGRRLTVWRNETLANGYHPITGVPLLADSDETCGSCAHVGRQGGVAGRFYKCKLNNTGGPKTDLRLSWPACQKWEPEHSSDT